MFLRWTVNYEQQMSFDEFKLKLSEGVDTKNETEEEILNKVKDILTNMG